MQLLCICAYDITSQVWGMVVAVFFLLKHHRMGHTRLYGFQLNVLGLQVLLKTVNCVYLFLHVCKSRHTLVGVLMAIFEDHTEIVHSQLNTNGALSSTCPAGVIVLLTFLPQLYLQVEQ
jgi:hypothetical protein